ncbi:MAG: hypothetical protein D6B28_07155 [Gammaproteobacteria bacterium]|nr:MAG: hypothetical protein D6B28_07155 [Gammaproteobacteria bacterium]
MVMKFVVGKSITKILNTYVGHVVGRISILLLSKKKHTKTEKITYAVHGYFAKSVGVISVICLSLLMKWKNNIV